MPRIARLGRDVIVVFGATEYVAPVKIRLFHAEGNRFTGVAYRIAPNPDGGETWTPDAFNEVDLLEVVERHSVAANHQSWIANHLGGWKC
jgi:hypothetical protein